MTAESARLFSVPRGRRAGLWEERFLPLAVVGLAVVVLWYVGAFFLNLSFERDQDARAGRARPLFELLWASQVQERPVLPAPHQVAVELWRSTVTVAPTSKRSLLYHGGVTLSSTLLGFAIGTLTGVLLAVAITHSRTLDKSVMPWIIASQTIPILAIAPMIIVIANAVGVTGLLPKAFISTYLSFFPVTVGMVKGLRAPDLLHLDLMRSYAASKAVILWKLRLPSSIPYLFAAMKVAIASALVGAIVGELPTGAVAGLGARLLAGSYYGQTVQIWAALIAAAIMAAVLVGLIGGLERAVRRLMGQQP